MDDDAVRGMGEARKQAEEGLKLFGQEVEAELDTAAATAYKEKIDAEIAAIDAEANALTGKDNKKARADLGKKSSAMKTEEKYIDACKVVKGLQPKNGNFVVKAGGYVPSAAAAAKTEEKKEETKAAKKDDKPKKEKECAGISRAEKDELEKIKTQIIDKKKELKEQGMSGGQMNKNEEIVAMVARMNELKEKECPGSTTAAKDDKKEGKKEGKLSAEVMKQLEEKEAAYAEYMNKLQTEFKYTKKEIAADPDAKDMLAEIQKLKKGK